MRDHQTSPTPGGRRRIRWRDLIDEPCRLFFPLGVLWALIGVLFWIPKAFSPALEAVSTKVHVFIQVYGFLWAFAMGFLGTAIPRFSGTHWLTPAEVLLQAALSVACVTALLLERYQAAHLCFAASTLLFLLSLAPRMLARKRPLPPTAVFVPFGILAATAGGLIMVIAPRVARGNLPAWIELAGNLLFQGFMLFFLMGIGGFLIRSILGWQAMPSPTAPAAAPPVARNGARWHLAGAVALLASFPIETFLHPRAGLLLRAVIVTLECILQLHIHRRHRSTKLGATWIQLALWLLVIGLWGLTLFPATYRLAFLHLCFVGGYAISIVAVATRVALSHGGFPHLMDRRSLAFASAITLMVLGLATRFAVDFVPLNATKHLAYAAGAWGLGLLVWSLAYLPKLFSRPAHDEHEA